MDNSEYAFITRPSLTSLLTTCQCFATIKFRNPRLWNALRKSSKGLLPKIAIDSESPDNVFSLVSDKLSYLKLNRPLLMQLETVYHYLLDGSLRGNVNILRTFVDDISGTDVTKWYWPNYKLLATVSCLGQRDKRIHRLFECFQLLIVSFACFHPNKSSFVTESMILKFVKNDLLAVKERQPKRILSFVPAKGSFVTSFELARMCKLHFDTVSAVLNLQTQLGNSSAVSLAFDKICLVLEGLTHVFLTLAPPAKNSRPMADKCAFKQRYLHRSRHMSQKYTKELYAALERRSDNSEEKLQCLRIIIRELLSLIDKVQWAEHVRSRDAINYRLNLQSALLVTGDLGLVSRFRLVRWPQWSILLKMKDQ